MSDKPKEYGPIDIALSDALGVLLDNSPLSLRAAARAAGMSHNRLGKIIRRETPPASPGEIDAIAIALGSSASEVFASAERSDYMKAARDRDDNRETEAQQIDP